MGLGTGLGSALIFDGVIAPLELAHLPYKKGKTYEDYLGARGLAKHGKKKWRLHVEEVCKLLKAGMQAEDLVIGGGDAKQLKEAPDGARLGDNANAFIGGFRMWESDGKTPGASAWAKPAVPRTRGATRKLVKKARKPAKEKLAGASVKLLKRAAKGQA
jgi:hypothetical protein